MPVDTSVFLVEVAGRFTPTELRIVWRDQPRAPHPVLEPLIQEAWERRLDQVHRSGGVLFNGELTRYQRHELRDGVLTIEVGKTDYREFIGTNFGSDPRRHQVGWEHFSNPIGTSTTVITRDGWIVLGRRSERVACHAGYIHTFGGGLEAHDRRSDGTFDAFASIARELFEELGVADEQVAESICLGLIRDPEIRQPELIFDTRVHNERWELLDRLRPDDAHEEHTEILTCRDEPDAILPFIRAATPMAPVAIGALCLHARLQFGEDWYRQTLESLG